MALIPLQEPLLTALFTTIEEYPKNPTNAAGWRFRVQVDDRETIGFIDNPFDVSNVYLLIRNAFAENIWEDSEYIYVLDNTHPSYSPEHGFSLNAADLGVGFSYLFLNDQSHIVMPKMNRIEGRRQVRALDLKIPIEVDMAVQAQFNTRTGERKLSLEAFVHEELGGYLPPVFLFSVRSEASSNEDNPGGELVVAFDKDVD